MKMEGVLVCLLGAPKLIASGTTRPLERKSAGLLAYLALKGETARTMLGALLWPNVSPEGARNNLRQTLFKLKKIAGVELLAGDATLRLIEGVCVDAEDTSLAKGELLATCDYTDCQEFAQWLEGTRARLARRILDQAVARLDELERAGEIDEALSLVEETLQRAPFSEPVHRRAIRLQYLKGGRAAALSAIRSCTRYMREEMGTEPSAETLKLIELIQCERLPVAHTIKSPMPVTLLRPPRLVGRERELQALRDAWDHGQAFMAIGEAGLGKSRLLAEFVATREGVVHSSARPGDHGIPYASLARLLRALLEPRPDLIEAAPRAELARLLPELSTRMGRPQEASPLLLQRAIAAVLAAGEERGVKALVLDDLHYADDASVEMLHFLIGAESPGTMRWGFAQRPAEGGAAVRLLRGTLTTARASAEVVLAPLDQTEMAQLIDSLAVPKLEGATLSAALVRYSGGNPLFALETLKNAFAEGIDVAQLSAGLLPRPANVLTLIELRLKQLRPEALALARVAALAGPDFSADLAASVLRTPPLALADAWNELEAAQVLREAGFAHDLVFEATLRGIPAPIARQTCRAVAQFMQENHGEPARLAEQWIAAGEPVRAVPHLRQAAVRAEAAARFTDARALIERAIEVTEKAALRSESLELQFLLVELLKEIGARDSALEVVRRMHANTVTPDEQLRVSRSEMQVLCLFGESSRAIMVGRQLLQDADLVAEATPLRLAELRHMLAEALRVSLQPRESIQQLSLIEESMDDHPDPQFRGWFHWEYAASLHNIGQISQAEPHAAAALVIAREVGRRRMIAGIMRVLGELAHAAGRPSEALDRFREAQLLVSEDPDANFSRVLLAQIAQVLLDLGRFRETLQTVETFLSRSATVDPAWLCHVHSVRALAYAYLGQPRRAARDAAEAQRLSVPGRSGLLVAAHQCEMHWLTDDVLDQPLARFQEQLVDGEKQLAQWHMELLRMLTAPAADLRARASSIAEQAASRGAMGHALAARLATACAAHAARDPGTVLDHALSALQLMRRYTPASSYRPRYWLMCHELLRPLDPESGRRSLREGIDWVHTVARYHVPEEFRDSFLHRNPVNRALLRAATRGTG